MSSLEDIRWFGVRNDDPSEDVPPWGVMEITGRELRSRRTLLTVRKPSTTFQRLYVVNGPGVIRANGGHGSGTFDMTYALANASTSYGQSWGVKPAEWKLFQGRPGFFAYGGSEGTGSTLRSLFRQQEVLEVWGVLTGSLSQGSSASMTIETRDGAAWTSSGFSTITVRDRLLKSGADAIQSGKHVVATWYGDNWWASSAECNT